VFLIIRNYKLTGDSSKWHAFGKAYLIYQAYNSITGASNISTPANIHQALNPTYALQLWFWEMGSFNHGEMNLATNYLITVYDAGFLGRYFWVYISAPLAAAIPAGIMAKKHLEILADGGTRSANELENKRN